jgi:hypothetical protein
MSASRNRKHIFVPGLPASEQYTPHPRKIEPKIFDGPRNRRQHARNLAAALREAYDRNEVLRARAGVTVHDAEPGLYIQFESPAGFDLKLDSLEDRRKGIELVAVQTLYRGPSRVPVQLATAFVPDGKLKHFFDRFTQYATENTEKGQPRHKDLVARIADLRRATLRALWTDTLAAYPGIDESIWWEVWLRRHDGHELQRITEFAGAVEMQISDRRLTFDDRIVVLLKGTPRVLSKSLLVLNDVAEVRLAKQCAAFFIELPPNEQADWVQEMTGRIVAPGNNATAVCSLDTGVTRGHPLLAPLISAADATSVDLAWGANDNGGGAGSMGHGTEMAGLAAYGHLATALASVGPIQVLHKIESVKILPPVGANSPDLYGSITAQAVARPEIAAPQRLRVFSLAVTATDRRDRGQPTSWSAAIDALCAGRSFDAATQGLIYLDDAQIGQPRMFVISAGNVPSNLLEADHLSRSDLEPIQDPAQAWNALTVGAATFLDEITDNQWVDWEPMAAHGDLSPWSCTSVTFSDAWPIKPEVVFEGGNVAIEGENVDFPLPEFSLLSTYYQPQQKSFVASYGTSASTAQVARIAARLRHEYRNFWPETVRALLIHSARWTPAMEAHLQEAAGKKERAKLLRRYGFGVPDETRASRSADDALTLVSQATIHPFANGKMGEMHVHELPWPQAVLGGLGETPVRLRVTLSYFIEPNPGRRGWKRRHRYASHGLRFQVKHPTESLEDFRKRLNQEALDEDGEEKPTVGSDSSSWFLGEQARNRGSIHSDIWVGTAADLADRGAIGIYPVSGWWKDQPKRDRSAWGARYALIVSIETDAEEVDLWTPVANEVGVGIEQVAITL